MKKILPALYLLLLLSNEAFCQYPNLQWVSSVDQCTNGNELGLAVTTDASGFVYSTGVFSCTMDFDPGPNETILNNLLFNDIFIAKHDPQGNLVWAKSIGSTSQDVAYSIQLDADGNVFVAGMVAMGSVDLDPGVGTFYFSGNNFLLKLDNQGEFVWATALAGYPRAFVIDPQGMFIVAGSFENTVDLDPGSGVQEVTASAIDAYVQKFNVDGSLIWARTIGGFNGEEIFSVDTDGQGNIYLGGEYSFTADFDPGTGYYPYTANGTNYSTDGFICKWSSSGGFIWAKSMGSDQTDKIFAVSVDEAGNVLTSGTFKSTIDFDPGPGEYLKTATGSGDIFLQKLDTDGNFLWVSVLSGAMEGNPFNIQRDSQNSIYLAGYFQGAVDVDPGAGIYELDGGMFFEKFSEQGAFVWAYDFNSQSQLGAIHIGQDDELYITGGILGTTDFDLDPTQEHTIDVSTASSNSDAWFLCKYNGINDPCADFNITFQSLNDVSCIQGGSAVVQPINGTSPYTYSWNTTPATLSESVIFEESGLYTLIFSDATVCTKSKKILINGPGMMADLDLNANLISGSFRSGFPASVSLAGFNNGCIPATGRMALVSDYSLLTFESSTIPPSSVSGDTMYWDFTDLTYDSGDLVPTIHFLVNTSAAIGDTVKFELLMSSEQNDAEPSNNFKVYKKPVINGYDPNDIQVYPAGECEGNLVEKGERLTYTIRFQNTGNAEAVNIVVSDSISPFLDLNSMRVIGSSFEDLYTEIIGGNVVKFHFDSIMLPDSMNNETASHGYVIYEIDPLPNVANGMIVHNRAEIYFDFNPAVVTNTTSITLVDVVPDCLLVSVPEVAQASALKIYPNPTDDYWMINSPKAVSWRLMNTLGQELMHGKSSGANFEIDARRLNAGIYLLKTESGIYRLIKN